MQVQTVLDIYNILYFPAKYAFFTKVVKKNGTLKVNSEVSKNTAKVFFHVSWLKKSIEVLVKDENGIKLSKNNDNAYGDLKLGSLDNVDLNYLDHHFFFIYKGRKVWILHELAQLDGKDVDINKPIIIIIKKEVQTHLF